ncbi:MAG: hypothetical protein H7Y89_11050 [Steroidobacteraceae bacterium]|nr:hypothetical protein [Steroidobacteraceae bacterium]
MNASTHKPDLRRAILAALALGLPCGAWADVAWEFTPTVEAGYLIDDNYRLAQAGSEIEVSGPLVDAELAMRTLTQRGEFSFTPRVRSTYFPDETDLDSTDYFGALEWLHNGQRVTSRVRGDFALQDVVNSEQPDAGVDTDLGEVDIGDGGRVLTRNERMRFAVRPDFRFDLSPRKEIQIGAIYTDVSYDDQIEGAQVDFNLKELTAGLVSRINERSTLTTRVRGAQFDIETLGTTDSYGAELEWSTRSVSETRTFLRAGAQNVSLPSGADETAWIAGGGINWIAGRNELLADIVRSVAPSSAGVVITRDQLRMRLTRAMTPRLELLAGLRGIHDDEVDDASAFTARSYATADLGLQWRWQEEFAFRIAADYTWQEFDGGEDDANSTGAMLSVIYQPQQRLRPRND